MSAVIAAVYVFGIISMWDSSAGRTSVDTYKSIQAEFDSEISLSRLLSQR